MEHPNNQYSDFAKKITYGVFLARKKMLLEKAKNDEQVIVADRNGCILKINAKQIIESNKLFQD